MSFNIDINFGILFVRCYGRLNIENAIELENELKERFQSDVKYMIFNFKNVEYISSSGIRVLVSSLKKIQDNNGILVLSEVSEPVIRVLKLVGLQDKFVYTNSDQEAIEYINERK